MRKSDRIRLLELEVVRLNFELEYVKAILNAALEADLAKPADLESGKWYTKKTKND